MPRPKKVFALVAAAQHKRRRLSDWMRTHRVELAIVIGRGRGQWPALMDVIRQLDLRDERGRAVTQDTASRTWARVQREAAAIKAERQQVAFQAPPRLPPGEIAPGVRLPKFQSSPGPLLTETSPALAASAQAAAAPSPSPARTALGAPAAQPGAGATEQIRRALASLGTDRVPTAWRP